MNRFVRGTHVFTGITGSGESSASRKTGVVRTLRRRGQQGGFTLIEFIVVAVLIAIAVLGILAYISRATAASQTQTEIKGLTSIISSTKLYKAGGTYGSSDLTPVLINRNQIPTAGFSINGNTVYNQWGGILGVQGAGPAFTVVDNGVTQASCVDVLQAVGNSETTITAATNNGPATKVNGTITAAVADTACGTGAQKLVFTVND